MKILMQQSKNISLGQRNSNEKLVNLIFKSGIIVFGRFFFVKGSLICNPLGAIIKLLLFLVKFKFFLIIICVFDTFYGIGI